MNAGYMERYNKSLVKEAVAEYEALAAKHGLTPSELALAWCKSRWGLAALHGTALRYIGLHWVVHRDLRRNAINVTWHYVTLH